jgi:acetyl esterase/lipase
MKHSILVLTFLLGIQTIGSAAKPQILNIWPGKAPGEIKELQPEADTTGEDGKLVAGKPLIRLGNVSTPQIAIYKPEPAKDTGASVIIAPGGGHYILAYDLEGTEIAEWLNTIGITGIVLKYRVPGRNAELRWKAAVQDAQRSVSLVRARAKEFGINPNKIGLMGFSAGAQTAGLTALLQARQYAPVDGYDQHSFVPDFVGLIYLGRNIHDEAGIRIQEGLPPFFMAVAHDDADRAISSAELYIALKKVNVSSELHIFESGGHGYGLRPTEKPVTGWNNLMAAWLKQIGML